MIDNVVRELTERYPELEGAKILNLLSSHPNRSLMNTVVELALTPPLSVDEAEASVFHPAAIPMTDYQTLRELDKRLKRLFHLKAHYLAEQEANPGFDAKTSPSPYDEEIEALRKYRKESTRPNGKLQSFPDEIRKAYRRHAAAIRRLFTKAEKAGHREAVEIVKRSLKPGYYSVLEVDFSCESYGCSNLDS